jgi:hypothetical protein
MVPSVGDNVCIVEESGERHVRVTVEQDVFEKEAGTPSLD